LGCGRGRPRAHRSLLLIWLSRRLLIEPQAS
jgi:hypothetical protein